MARWSYGPTTVTMPQIDAEGLLKRDARWRAWALAEKASVAWQGT